MTEILLHGLGQTPDSWNYAIYHQIAPPQVRILRPDYFRMVQGDETTYQALYEGAARYFDSFEEPLDLGGLSLGGMLALDYAIRQPERVRSLVLAAVQYKPPRRLLKMQNQLFRWMSEDRFQKIGLERTQAIQLCRSIMEVDFTPSLPQIQCPVLLLCGEKDRINRGASRRLEKLLPQSQLWMIPDAGHQVMLDSPSMVGTALRVFYRRNCAYSS